MCDFKHQRGRRDCTGLFCGSFENHQQSNHCAIEGADIATVCVAGLSKTMNNQINAPPSKGADIATVCVAGLSKSMNNQINAQPSKGADIATVCVAGM